MHVKDLRGTTAIACGSVIHGLVKRSALLGGTQQGRLDVINAEMKAFQSAENTESRMPELRLDDLVLSGWSTLSGKLVKAANTRHMLHFVLHLVRAHIPPVDAFAKSVHKVITELNNIEAIIYGADMFMTDDELNQLREAWLRVGRHWQYLRHLSAVAEQNEWQITPKVHYAQHIPEQCALINARAVQCYQSESLIGRVALVWKSCASGPYEGNIQKSALIKHLVALEVRLCTAT